MKNISIILFLSCLIILSFSCKKDENAGDPSYTYISESVKPYIFKTGTWWCYAKDSSSVFDTLKLTSTETGFFWSELAINGSNGVKSEFFQMNLKSTFNGSEGNYYSAFDYMRKNGGGNFGEFGQPVLFTGQPVGYGFSGAKVDSLIPFYSVNGVVFNNVIKIKITKTEQYQVEYEKDTYLYFVPGIGLVRKETVLDSGQLDTWSLKSWNIVN